MNSFTRREPETTIDATPITGDSNEPPQLRLRIIFLSNEPKKSLSPNFTEDNQISVTVLSTDSIYSLYDKIESFVPTQSQQKSSFSNFLLINNNINNNEKKIYLQSGVELLPAFSFAFYGVKDNETLYVKNIAEIIFRNYMMTSKVKIESTKTQKRANRKKLMNEASKLRDLFFRKIDSSYNSTKKVIIRYNQFINSDLYDQIIANTKQNQQHNQQNQQNQQRNLNNNNNNNGDFNNVTTKTVTNKKQLEFQPENQLNKINQEQGIHHQQPEIMSTLSFLSYDGEQNNSNAPSTEMLPVLWD